MKTRMKLFASTAVVVGIMAMAPAAHAETSLMDKIRGFVMPETASYGDMYIPTEEEVRNEKFVVNGEEMTGVSTTSTEIELMVPPQYIEPAAGDEMPPQPEIQNIWENVPGATVPATGYTVEDAEEQSFVPRSGFENPFTLDGSDLNAISTAAGETTDAVVEGVKDITAGFENPTPVMDGAELNAIMTAAGEEEAAGEEAAESFAAPDTEMVPPLPEEIPVEAPVEEVTPIAPAPEMGDAAEAVAEEVEETVEEVVEDVVEDAGDAAGDLVDMDTDTIPALPAEGK